LIKFYLFDEVWSVCKLISILPFWSMVKLGMCAINPSNVWVNAVASRDRSLLGDFSFCHNSFLIDSNFFNFRIMIYHGIMIYQRWHFLFSGEYASWWKFRLGSMSNIMILLSSLMHSFLVHLFIMPVIISLVTS
jgi:hypothetical protein